MIAVAGLTKRFGDVVAVDGLTFEAGRGVTGFLGPNGAGKTTTMRIVLGLVSATTGSATIDGLAYRELDAPARHVGATLETAAFHPGRTARDHLRVVAAASRIPRGRVEEVLALVDLRAAADRRVGGFSFGMRQRLGLATALLGDPGVLVLDEPATGLDPDGVRWLRDLLRALGGEGRTVLVSSHILAEVAQTVDRVVIIDHGRLVTQGDIDAVEAAAGAVVHVCTAEPDRLQALLAGHGFSVTRRGDDALEVRGASTEDVGRVVRDEAVLVTELHEERSSLEQAFLALTGTGGGGGG